MWTCHKLGICIHHLIDLRTLPNTWECQTPQMDSPLLYQVSNQSRMMHFQRLIRALVGRFSSCLGLSPMVIAFLVLQSFICKTCWFFTLRKLGKSLHLLLLVLLPGKKKETRAREMELKLSSSKNFTGRVSVGLEDSICENISPFSRELP